MTSKISRREIQRQIAAANIDTSPDELAKELGDMLDTYQPTGTTQAEWDNVRDVFVDTMRAAQIRGAESFKKHLGVVARFLLWRANEHQPVVFPDVFNQVDVDRYYMHGINGSDKTRNDYRSRLTNICKRVNPSPDAVLLAPPMTHRSVRPGFTDAEMRQIRLSVTRERSRLVRRQLCAVVGLCAGAGLSTTDLRALTVDRIVDHGVDGIEIRIPGPAARTVWVREEYEDLVRTGINDMAGSQLVIGSSENRKNVAGNLVARAGLHDCPHFDASRLRSTWLTWMMTRPVPLQVILYASGLKSARTLTELLDHLDSSDLDASTMRTGMAS